eukprot:jgi/Picre1/33847/NNA_001326.t1
MFHYGCEGGPDKVLPDEENGLEGGYGNAAGSITGGASLFTYFDACSAETEWVQSCADIWSDIEWTEFFFWNSTWLAPALPAGAKDLSKYSMLEAVGRVGALGLVLVSVLSGYGTVSVPFSYISLLSDLLRRGRYLPWSRSCNRQQCQRSKRFQKWKSCKRIEDKRANDDVKANFFSKFVTAISSVGVRRILQDITNLEVEISSLSSLESALQADIVDLRKQRYKAQISRTMRGHVQNLLGYILSIYCIYRMFASSKALVVGEDTSSDPVSKTLAFILRFFSGGSLRLDVQAFSQYLTLAFVGFISITSLRGFIMHMQSFFSFFRGARTSSVGFVLFLTELLGFIQYPPCCCSVDSFLSNTEQL